MQSTEYKQPQQRYDNPVVIKDVTNHPVAVRSSGKPPSFIQPPSRNTNENIKKTSVWTTSKPMNIAPSAPRTERTRQDNASVLRTRDCAINNGFVCKFTEFGKWRRRSQ